MKKQPKTKQNTGYSFSKNIQKKKEKKSLILAKGKKKCI